MDTATSLHADMEPNQCLIQESNVSYGSGAALMIL